MIHEEENNVEEVVVDEQTSDIVEIDEEVTHIIESEDVVEEEETREDHPLPWLYDHEAERTGLFKEYGESFNFLGHEPELPIMVETALGYYGVTETKGKENTPEIMEWAKELGGWQGNGYTADSTPWCGLFMAIVAKDSGVAMPKKMVWLRAKDWAKIGSRVSEAGLGDILVFSRKGGGHVGLYLAEDDTHYYVLGGNQKDMVRVSRIAKDRIADIRRVKEHRGLSSVRKFSAETEEEESTNEA